MLPIILIRSNKNKQVSDEHYGHHRTNYMSCSAIHCAAHKRSNKSGDASSYDSTVHSGDIATNLKQK